MPISFDPAQLAGGIRLPEVAWFANLKTPAPGGISNRFAEYHRLARQAGSPRLWQQHYPAPGRLACIALEYLFD